MLLEDPKKKKTHKTKDWNSREDSSTGDGEETPHEVGEDFLNKEDSSHLSSKSGNLEMCYGALFLASKDCMGFGAKWVSGMNPSVAGLHS